MKFILQINKEELIIDNPNIQFSKERNSFSANRGVVTEMFSFDLAEENYTEENYNELEKIENFLASQNPSERLIISYYSQAAKSNIVLFDKNIIMYELFTHLIKNSNNNESIVFSLRVFG